MVETTQMSQEDAEKRVLDLWKKLNKPQKYDPETIWRVFTGDKENLVFQVDEEVRLIEEAFAKHLVADAYSEYIGDVKLPEWTSVIDEKQSVELLLFQHPGGNVTKEIAKRTLARRQEEENKTREGSGDNKEEPAEKVKKFADTVAEHATWLNWQMEKNLMLQNDEVFSRMFIYAGEEFDKRQGAFYSYVQGKIVNEMLKELASEPNKLREAVELSYQSLETMPIPENVGALIAYADDVIERFNEKAKEKPGVSIALTGKDIVQPEGVVAEEALELVGVTEIYRAAGVASNQRMKQPTPPPKAVGATPSPARVAPGAGEFDKEIAMAGKILNIIPGKISSSVLLNKHEEGHVSWVVQGVKNEDLEAFYLMAESLANVFSSQNNLNVHAREDASGKILFTNGNGGKLSEETSQELIAFLNEKVKEMRSSIVPDEILASLAASLVLEEGAHDACEPTEMLSPMSPGKTSAPLGCER